MRSVTKGALENSSHREMVTTITVVKTLHTCVMKQQGKNPANYGRWYLAALEGKNRTAVRQCLYKPACSNTQGCSVTPQTRLSLGLKTAGNGNPSGVPDTAWRQGIGSETLTMAPRFSISSSGRLDYPASSHSHTHSELQKDHCKPQRF